MELKMHPTFNCETMPWDSIKSGDFSDFPKSFYCGKAERYGVTIHQQGDGEGWAFNTYAEAKAKFIEAKKRPWTHTATITRYRPCYSPYWGGEPYLASQLLMSVYTVRPEPVYEVFGGDGDPITIRDMANHETIATVQQVIF